MGLLENAKTEEDRDRDVVGACCRVDGSCYSGWSEADCTGPSAVEWFGGGSDCATITCPHAECDDTCSSCNSEHREDCYCAKHMWTGENMCIAIDHGMHGTWHSGPKFHFDPVTMQETVSCPTGTVPLKIQDGPGSTCLSCHIDEEDGYGFCACECAYQLDNSCTNPWICHCGIDDGWDECEAAGKNCWCGSTYISSGFIGTHGCLNCRELDGGDGGDGGDSDSDSDGDLDGGFECVVDISQEDCLAADGVWNVGGECTGECDYIGDDCTNYGADLCVNPCCDPIACCKNGSCIGDTYGQFDEMHPETKLPPLTRVSCEYIYGGIAVPGVCGEVDCCNATIYVGACCIETWYGRECQVMDAQTCKDSTNHTNGIFMGPNSDCNTVDCCDPFGACCIVDLNGYSSCGNVAHEQACISVGGVWQGRGTDCNDAICMGRGACCYPTGGCVDDVPASDCACGECTYHGEGSTCCPLKQGKSLLWF